MTGDLILKVYSPHPLGAYPGCGPHFASHYMRPPEEIGEQEGSDFFCIRFRDRNASPATQDVYVNALKFL